MDSRLHGNDGGRRRTTHGRRQRAHIAIPATAGGGALHTVGGSAPHIVIPATAGIHGGGRLRWVPVYTGTTAGDGAPHTVGGGAPTSSFPATAGGGAPHIVIPRDGGESTAGGDCDGFTSTRERRWATAHPTR